MSDLIAVAYPDRESVAAVVRTLGDLQSEDRLELHDIAIVVRQRDGRVRLQQTNDLINAEGSVGMVWGGLIGRLFLAPLLGLLLGGVTGALAGSVTDYGIDDKFVRELGMQLKPGGAAVVALVDHAISDDVLERICRHGGTILRTVLSRQAEVDLESALHARA